MDKEWSVADKKHRMRLKAGRLNRLVFIDDKTGEKLVGGGVKAATYVFAEGQLYFGIPVGIDYLSIRFVRIYKDGRPDDATGFQDYKLPASKRTFNVSPHWIGWMDPSYTLAIEVRWPGSKEIVIGNRMYKGVS